MNALGAGDHIHDEFVYAIRLANGTLSQARVTIDITGQNDAAVISGSHTGNVVEDTTLTASGTLTVVDPDHGQSHTQSVIAASHNSNNHLGSYSCTPIPVAPPKRSAPPILKSTSQAPVSG